LITGNDVLLGLELLLGLLVCHRGKFGWMMSVWEELEGTAFCMIDVCPGNRHRPAMDEI
jgi:hypothetical protein